MNVRRTFLVMFPVAMAGAMWSPWPLLSYVLILPEILAVLRGRWGTE